jgi:hypothetical protein
VLLGKPNKPPALGYFCFFIPRPLELQQNQIAGSIRVRDLSKSRVDLFHPTRHKPRLRATILRIILAFICKVIRKLTSLV